MNQKALNLLVEQPNYDINLLIEEQGANRERRMFFEGIFMRANEKNKNNRIYPLNEMIKEVNRYDKEMIKTGRSIGELVHPSCNLETARILTENGWIGIKDVKQGDKVYTLNTDTNQIELNVVERKIEEKYEGKMVRIKGRNIDTIVTPNHRLLIKTRYNGYKYVTAEQLLKSTTEYAHEFIPRRGEWISESPEFFTLKGVQNVNPNVYNVDVTKDININYKTFMQFLGIWLAEGYISSTGNHYAVYITQKNKEVSELIEKMIYEFPEEMYWVKRTDKNDCNLYKLTDRRLWEYLKPLGNAYNKYIPEEIKKLSPELLDELIYWFNLGDGRFCTTIYKDMEYISRNIFSVSKRLVDDLHECLLKSGGCGNITEIITESDYMFADHLIMAKNKVPLYELSIATTQGIYLDKRFLEVTEEDVSDMVYCVTTKNSNFYCMENGKSFWSGNSVEINPERACHLVTEFRQDRNNFYGKSKILETPMGQIVKTLMLDGVKLGVSTRALGKLTEKDDHNDVSEFRLICCDVVHDPSVDTAFVEGIFEAKQYILKCDGTVCEFVEKTYETLENNLCSLPKHSDDKQQQLSKSVIEFINTIKNM